MGIKEKKESKKTGKSGISTVLYIAASVVALIGVGLLVSNISMYRSTVTKALADGYDIVTIREALVTSQLIPGIAEPIGIYGGISFILFGVGIIGKKVSKCLSMVTKVEVTNDTISENIILENTIIGNTILEDSIVEEIFELEKEGITELAETEEKTTEV
jgi:hypothetical protein